MLYFNFKNYEEFKELFGVRVCGNGAKQRQNNILLQSLKGLFKYRETPWAELLMESNSMVELKSRALLVLRSYSTGYSISLDNGALFHHPTFRTDETNGICYDGDAASIRYINTENDRAFKMRAGKFLKKIHDAAPVQFPETLLLWLCEEFASDWRAHAQTKCDKYTLHVDEDFERIYNCRGYFGSCMSDEGFHTFYEDAVDCKAAYITAYDDETCEDEVFARCVIYNDVRCDDGKTYRLAERQYARDKNDDLKRILVNLLIAGGHIDGYKKVGAGCCDTRAFVKNDGSDFESTRFEIDCNLEPGGTVSYQDSFKYYDLDSHTADNYSGRGDDLSITNGRFREDGDWSEYNGEYIPEYDSVWIESREDYFWASQTVYAQNTQRREFEEDCVRLASDDYAYAGYLCEDMSSWDIYECPVCGEYFINEDGAYSELTGDSYCCDGCLREAEDDYKSQNWTYSDYDGEYFEDEDDVIIALLWMKVPGGYRETTIHIDTFNDLCERGGATEFCHEYFIDEVLHDGEPMHYAAAM